MELGIEICWTFDQSSVSPPYDHSPLKLRNIQNTETGYFHFCVILRIHSHIPDAAREIVPNLTELSLVLLTLYFLFLR